MPEDRIPELAINAPIAREGRAATRYRIPKSAALAELLRLITSPVFWTFAMPRGDGHSVFELISATLAI